MNIDRERAKIKVKLYESDYFERYRSNGDKAFPPDNLIDFISWAQVYVDKTPEEYRDKIEIDISSETSYGSDYPQVEIYYWRMETDEEYGERLNQIEERSLYIQKKEEMEERNLYEKLKKKYEGG